MSPSAIAAGLLSGSAPILLEAQVGAEVATLQLRYQDGVLERAQPVEGFVLVEIRARHWPLGHRLEELVGLDDSGKVIARQPIDTKTPGTYPCANPVDIGGGLKACP